MKSKRWRALFVALAIALGAVACARRCDKTRDSLRETPEPRAETGAAECVNGRLAMGYIEEILSLGPRHAGTEGKEKTRRYIIEKLRSFGLEPKRSDFTALTPHPELKQVAMANITVDIPGPNRKKVLIAGHFDAKLLPGVDFKGANDGGSSTALLLEMARCLKLHRPPCPVRIAFFDGEEALVKWSDSDSLYGSKRFAAEIAQAASAKEFAAAVVVDMIGDKRLKLTTDMRSTPWVLAALKAAAVGIGKDAIFGGPSGGIEDDHVPLLGIGIPTALLIDFDYGPGWTSNGYWHTDQDTADKLSPQSLETIGRVVLGSLPELAAH